MNITIPTESVVLAMGILAITSAIYHTKKVDRRFMPAISIGIGIVIGYIFGQQDPVQTIVIGYLAGTAATGSWENLKQFRALADFMRTGKTPDHPATSPIDTPLESLDEARSAP